MRPKPYTPKELAYIARGWRACYDSIDNPKYEGATAEHIDERKGLLGGIQVNQGESPLAAMTAVQANNYLLVGMMDWMVEWVGEDELAVIYSDAVNRIARGGHA